MQIYAANAKGPLKTTGYIDPDDISKITVFWGCPEFKAAHVYRIGDICAPTTDNGYYYQCTVNGITGTEPTTWDQETQISGTAEFAAIPWDLWVYPDQSIQTSTWLVFDNNNNSNTVALTNANYTDYSTSITVYVTDPTITQFVLTNQITKDDGEKLSRSFLYKINQQ